jgi:protein gp37
MHCANPIMGDQSKIQWTDATWSPVRGCSMVSAGCTNCYAMRQAHRWPQFGELTRSSATGRVWTGEVRTFPDLLLKPFEWIRPRHIFVNSQSDTFHPSVPFDFVDWIFAVAALTPHHTYQVLTKRPERMREYLTFDGGFGRSGYVEGRARALFRQVYNREPPMGKTLNPGPMPHVWLGVTVEDQAAADERIPILLETPAAVRFLSCEPLLGPLTLNPWLLSEHGRRQIGAAPGIGWVIVGGESGPRARPMDLAWARRIVEQCQNAGVACFVKQVGARPFDTNPADPTMHRELRPRDAKGGDPLEWPDELRVRHYPHEVTA